MYFELNIHLWFMEMYSLGHEMYSFWKGTGLRIGNTTSKSKDWNSLKYLMNTVLSIS